jgi:hypothetical protein
MWKYVCGLLLLLSVAKSVGVFMGNVHILYHNYDEHILQDDVQGEWWSDDIPKTANVALFEARI